MKNTPQTDGRDFDLTIRGLTAEEVETLLTKIGDDPTKYRPIGHRRGFVELAPSTWRYVEIEKSWWQMPDETKARSSSDY